MRGAPEPLPVLLTYPMDEDAALFYGRFGFEPSPLREDQLLLLLKNARRWWLGDVQAMLTAGFIG